MVYPRDSGRRTLSKFIVVCALAISFQSAAAVDVAVTTAPPIDVTATTAPPIDVTATTATITSAAVCSAAAGDIAVGVQAIPDASCEVGGLGCYSTACRFCKYSETAKSAHLLACSGFGYDFPTLAPEIATTSAPASAGDCSISEGDTAVGIRAITDVSCAIGGLGCYSDHCRYCKGEETSQSAHLADCSTFATTPIAQATATPAPVGIGSLAPVSGTAEPVDATTASVAPTAEPVAINPETVVPVIDTIAPTAESLAPVSTDPAAPLVASTVIPGTSTPSTETPAGTTATPTTDPVFGQADYVGTECTIDEAFKELGVDVVADATVTNLDADYYADGCRFCKIVESVEFESFTFCALFAEYYSGTTTAPETVEPVATSSTPTIVGETIVPIVPDATTAVPVPDATTAAPVTGVTTTAAPVADATATAAPVVAASVCSKTVSEGDAAAGIEIITDATCANGGLGCIDSICRFCKVTETLLSAHLGNCSELLNPPAASGSLDATCDMVVNPGDSAIGLIIVADASCLAVGGLGCIGETACKFCKQVETPQSAVYAYCDGYPLAAGVPASGSAATAAAVAAPGSASVELPVVAAVDVAIACAGNELSAGDAAGGIAYTYDPEHCPAGTTAGCLGQAGCKLCKHVDTGVSSHLDFCPGYPVAEAEGASPALRVQAAAGESQGSFGEFFNQNTALVYAVGAAACVGAIAVMVVVVVGTKRAVRSLRRGRSELEDEEVDEEASSVLSSNTIVTAEEADASLSREA